MHRFLWFVLATALGMPGGTTGLAADRATVSPRDVVDLQLNLGSTRLAQPQTYHVGVEMRIQSAGEKEPKVVSYLLDLHCDPNKGETADGGQEVDYTCRHFGMGGKGRAEATIPSLVDWSYTFAYPAADLAPGGNVFGLPNSKFQALTDSNGKALGPQMDFLVYNAFTDYHTLCNVYAQALLGAAGIQELKRIGDRVKHGTSHARAVLGSVPGLGEGSEFVHGEVALELKGIGQVHDRPCAVVGFAAGENTFKMIFEPLPLLQIVSEGRTHHEGDLFIDLQSGWVAKATMTESVLSWVTAGGKETGPTVIRRSLRLERDGR